MGLPQPPPQVQAEREHHEAAGDGPGVVKRWVETDHFFNGVDRYAMLDEARMAA